MTAKYRIVRKSTPAQPSGANSKSPAPTRPEKPRVDIGPKGYGRTKKGHYIVIRFWVTQEISWRSKTTGRWWVMDCEDGDGLGIAKGTDRAGYPTKEKACEVARTWRDKYGAYGRMPF